MRIRMEDLIVPCFRNRGTAIAALGYGSLAMN